ncbi:hypothetical protein ATANTOWER_012242, partial [Ataeniobius toweri]|nr:hypothetical protein [Ataeniobius toweri]
AFCIITFLIKRSSCLHCKSSSLLLQTEPGQGLWPMPITKQEIGIQTDTHPIDSYIDKSYEWNEWELRRKAIKLNPCFQRDDSVGTEPWMTSVYTASEWSSGVIHNYSNCACAKGTFNTVSTPSGSHLGFIEL